MDGWYFCTAFLDGKSTDDLGRKLSPLPPGIAERSRAPLTPAAVAVAERKGYSAVDILFCPVGGAHLAVFRDTATGEVIRVLHWQEGDCLD